MKGMEGYGKKKKKENIKWKRVIERWKKVVSFFTLCDHFVLLKQNLN